MGRSNGPPERIDDSRVTQGIRQHREAPTRGDHRDSDEILRRYPDVADELADDLHRRIEDKSRRAKRPWLVVTRWAQRHLPLVLAIVATVLVALVALATSTFLLALACEQQRAQRKLAEQNTNQAIANLQLALEIVDVIYTRVVSKEVSPSQSNEPAKRVGAEKAAEESEKGNQTDQAEEDPEHDAALLRNLREFYEKLAGAAKTCPAHLLPETVRDGTMEPRATPTRPAEGRLVSRQSTDREHQWLQQKVLAFYEGFVAQRSSDPMVRLEIIKAYCRIGDIRRQSGQGEQSDGAYGAACEVWRRLVSDLPGFLEYRGQFDHAMRHGLTDYLLDRARAHRENGDSDRAIAKLSEALTIDPNRDYS
jgi:tetratricopeptide (TPR) repeat protein